MWGFAVIGTKGNHVTLQGLKIDGSMNLSQADNAIVRGNEFYGVIDGNGLVYNPTGANYSAINVWAGRETLVRNNYFQDYVADGGGGWSNNNAVLLWKLGGNAPTSVNTVVENNEFVNCNKGIYDKDWSRWNVFRKNWFRDSAVGIKFSGQGEHYNQSIYQNIVVNTGRAFMAGSYWAGAHDHLVYNNVVIDSSNLFFYSNQIDFYNNIHVPSDETQSAIHSRDSLDINYSNFNLFQPFSYVIYGSSGSSHRYNSLSAWQALGFDADSEEIDSSVQIFKDNKYRLIENSPYEDAGRYGEDLGVYPLGNEDEAIGRP